MADYLLDSDVIIWCLRGQKESVDFVRSIAEESLPACSSLSVLEVELGMKSGEEEATRSFLDSLRVVGVSKSTARKAADYIRTYQRKGRAIDFVDAAIAATCVEEGLILVTYNLKHYPMSDFVKRAP